MTVRIEGEQREVRRLALEATEGLAFAAVLHGERTATEVRRENDHERGDHRVALLRVLVRLEELARFVDQQLVELRLELAFLGKTELRLDRPEVFCERRLPTAGDLHFARRELP